MLKSFVFVCSSMAPVCVAQQLSIAGTYTGMLDNHRMQLKVTAPSNGLLNCTADIPDQHVTGLACASTSFKGQALSFSIPAVRGSWTGFVSPDGNSLIGIWNQGASAQLVFTRVLAVSGQGVPTPSNLRPGDVKWDNYIFKFDPTGQAAVVFEGDKPVGRVQSIAGQLQATAFQDGDAEKIKKSFADYQTYAARTSSGTAAPPPMQVAAVSQPGPTPPLATPPPPQSASCTLASLQSSDDAEPSGVVAFDDATHLVTVTRSDGITVTFDNQDTKINCGPLNYILRYRKGSVSRTLETNILHPHNHGGSASGAGVEFLFNGSLIYDSGMGVYGDLQTNSKIRNAKGLSKIAVAAVADVRNVQGHKDFTPPGYGDMKDLAKYKLRSDGSR